MNSIKNSGKRYFWWRLRNDFFTQITIKKLRRSENGDKKAIIYLQMILMTIHQDGYLRYDGIESNISEEIALFLNEPVKVVQETIEVLKEMNLIEIVEDDFFLPEAQNGIGSECASAERMRRKRARDEKTSQSDNEVTQALRKSDNEVTQALQPCDIEKIREEKDKEKDKEKRKNEMLSEINGEYLMATNGIPNGNQMSYQRVPQDRIGKDNIDKDSVDEILDGEEIEHSTLSKTSGIIFDPDKIINLFNDICTEYKPVTSNIPYSQQLSNCIIAGYKESDYVQVFNKANKSDYLKTYPSDFGWILEHLEEIKSGKYDTYRKE